MSVSSIMSLVKRPAQAPQDPDSVSVGVRGVLAATEKLLAINRGITETDERDSLQFKHLMTPDKLMQERIRMDADKTRFNLMRRLAKFRSLKPMNPGAFNSYTEGLLVGHPLSMPLEEINPMHLVEQARRVTHMGPGGLPSDDSITADSQNVNPSQFGFICPLSGPESSRAGVDARFSWGTKIGDDGKLYQKFEDRKAKAYRWLSASDLDGKTLGLPD